jgi:hypothetical protein
MLKWLIGFSSFALIATVILVARHDKIHNTEGKGCQIKCEESSGPPDAPRALVCTSEHSQKAKSGENDPPWWHIFFTWPEGITALLLMLTLGGITWQAWETREAAEAARDSIRLQEGAMRQWVNIVPLRVHVPPNFMESGEVTIQFEIVNRTDYLLTILKTEVEVMANVHDPRKFTVNCDIPLVPQKSAADDSYPFYGTAHAPADTWDQKGKLFIVGGTVTYRDSIGIRQTQDFHDLYLGYLDGRLERKTPSGLVPEEEQSKAHHQNPN